MFFVIIRTRKAGRTKRERRIKWQRKSRREQHAPPNERSRTTTGLEVERNVDANAKWKTKDFREPRGFEPSLPSSKRRRFWRPKKKERTRIERLSLGSHVEPFRAVLLRHHSIIRSSKNHRFVFLVLTPLHVPTSVSYTHLTLPTIYSV